MKKMKVKTLHPFKILVFGFLLISFFMWGLFTVRNKVFPYKILAKIHIKKQTMQRRAIESKSTRSLEKLRSLPYIGGTFDSKSQAEGVIINNHNMNASDYNLYSSSNKNTANLINMNGEVVHQWSYPSEAWQHVELLPNGDLIVIIKDVRILKIDKNSHLLWSYEGGFHHDVWVAENGDIYAMKRSAILDPKVHPKVKTLVDYIIILSKNGEKKEEFSLLKIFQESSYKFLLPRIRDLEFLPTDKLDILHPNHVEVFDGALANISSIYKKGNILISMRNINTIAILDSNKRNIIWVWGPTNLVFQHHPILLKNGNILLFNNGHDKSELLELDPFSFRVMWRYSPEEDFFSLTRGSNQRLPNGNTLITESDKGYVFEVTPDKRIVWKFANPEINNKSERFAIWRMKRFQPNELFFLSN